jgi:hypothetical protein
MTKPPLNTTEEIIEALHGRYHDDALIRIGKLLRMEQELLGGPWPAGVDGVLQKIHEAMTGAEQNSRSGLAPNAFLDTARRAMWLYQGNCMQKAAKYEDLRGRTEELAECIVTCNLSVEEAADYLRSMIEQDPIEQEKLEREGDELLKSWSEDVEP